MTAAKPSEVRFELCQTADKTAVLRSVIDQIFNYRRMLPAAILATLVVAALLFVWRGQEPLTPMVILGVLIAFFEWWMLISLALNRPKLLSSIDEMDGADYTLRWDGSALVLHTDRLGMVTYEKKGILTQYWMEEHYFLLLERDKKRRLIHLPVDKENFDNILLMANALEKQKVKFVKLNKKKPN